MHDYVDAAVFKLMAERRASDLFFTSFSPPMIKQNGELLPLNENR